jgi:hypothetical protein
MQNEPDRAVSRIEPRKPYRKPTLLKGPVLSNVTGAKSISGVPSKVVCWIARAAFGETDIRWMIFRGWLLDDAPLWFRHLYIAHGEAVGVWLATRTHARAVVRALMMPAVNRKLRG